MNKYILLAKIFLIIYNIYAYANGLMEHMALGLILALGLLALSVLVPVFKSRYVRFFLLFASLLIPALFFDDFPPLLLLVPVILPDIFILSGFSLKYCLPLVFILLPLAYQYDLEAVYFIVSGFSAVLPALYHKEDRLTELLKQYDALRHINDRLKKKLGLGEEIKHQLAYTAQLEERNRIAQEIHDKVGHSISGSLMQLEAVKLLAAKEPEKAAYMLQTVIDTLREGLESIRMALRNIKPPSEQMGLNRLQLILSEFREKHNIQATLKHEGDIAKVTPLVWSIFTENTAEALTNILKHSKADSVFVSLNVMNKLIRFQINDNGVVVGSVNKGLGLAGIEERLLFAGGRLLIDTSKGFTLTMLIPTEEDAHGH